MSLQAAIMDALAAAPKPLTEESALAVAIEAMTARNATRELQQFREWFKVNGKWLTEKANG